MTGGHSLELINRAILDSAALEIVLLDTDLKITEINNGCLEVIGIPKGDLLGQSANAIWDDQSIKKLREDLVRNRVFQEKTWFGIASSRVNWWKFHWEETLDPCITPFHL